MSNTETVDFDDEIPLLSPIQVIGGGVRIEPNVNLDVDDIVVTFEALANVPTPEGPQLGLLPILIEPQVWDMLIDTLEDIRTTPEEGTE